MIRYVCDACGATVDQAMPNTWTTVNVMGPTVADANSPMPPPLTTLTVCEQHNVRTLLGATA